jgi:hypothetical protein
MREPTYPIIVALALMLVASSFSAFGREGRGGFEERWPEEQTIRAPEEQTPLRTQTFGGRVYHGQLAWRDGRWRHEMPHRSRRIIERRCDARCGWHASSAHREMQKGSTGKFHCDAPRA